MTEEQLIAVAIPINQIRPDPAQPRRLLPRDLAESLSAGTSPSEILAQLRERAKRYKWIRERIAELDGLADSIAADGLMQPIRVIRDGENAYHIEAGERRWWAHQILIGRGDSRFENIATFVIQSQTIDRGILRRRVAENVHRSGFTAIELARAMALRIEEIAAEESTLSRREIEKRVGKESAMSDRRVRQFLSLLKLPIEVQEVAQQARLSEGSLRNLAAIRDRARQIAATRELINPKPKRISFQVRSKHEVSSNTRHSKNRASKKRHPASKPTTIQRLIALAREMQTQSIKTGGQQLKERIADHESDRGAIFHLRGILNLGLAESVEINPTRVRTGAHEGRGKGTTLKDD